VRDVLGMCGEQLRHLAMNGDHVLRDADRQPT